MSNLEAIGVMFLVLLSFAGWTLFLIAITHRDDQ